MQRFRFYVPAGVILGLFVLALVGLSGTREVSASGEPPTPTPAYAPEGSATIDVFFTLDGTPTIGLSPITDAWVHGELCTVPFPIQVVLPILSWPVEWPFPDERNPSVCSELGAVVGLCLSPNFCAEEFIFTGEDASVRMEVPAADAPRVQANFVTDAGQPAAVEMRQVSFRRGSFVCFQSVLTLGMTQTPPAPGQGFTMYWPLVHESCAFPSEIPITAQFSTVDHGELSATFVWEGEDVTTFDVVVPDIATATPSTAPPPTVSPTPTPSTAPMTASPTPTPALLPSAGGPPPPGSSLRLLPFLLLIVVLTTGALTFARRR
jgi:hypothetical protein